MTCENIKQMLCLNMIPSFYAEVITGFCIAQHSYSIENKSDLYNQFLWGNRLLKIDGKCLYSTSFRKSNYLFVNNVLELDGTFKRDIFEHLKEKKYYLRVIHMIRDALKPKKLYRFDNIETLIAILDVNLVTDSGGKLQKMLSK